MTKNEEELKKEILEGGLKEKELRRELEEFKREKKRIRQMLGQIGGKNTSKRHIIINGSFLILILILFFLELTTHFLPSNISLEISVLLVSIKIVWMIHSQQKVSHFEFWILNSIEFKVNEISKRIRKIEKEVKEIKKNEIRRKECQ
ncbi:MAG: hypothetical protein B6I28_01070 [Fusobacteriia bacterium 4572_132]|nr:MAG: hypothetical protein B6I28_01070 [Fusobacteriia bacterium 4572_132]